ncbi:MAG: hypothetical protein AAGA66_11305 [Bacteroidota bacterium]
MFDLTAKEKWMLVPLALLVLILGIYPKLILSFSEETINYFTSQLGGLQPGK